ncbi:MAG: 50S ribosomal protein L6, partial [Clostridia bacterium]|nr:50S ribosomal protein L6 [Clostridia bacterium]
MSRIGKQSIALPAGVTVAFENSVVTVKGGKGELTRKVAGAINVTCEDGHVHVVALDNEVQTNAYHGLYRALIADMVKGVSEGFTKALEIKGVGWKGAM